MRHFALFTAFSLLFVGLFYTATAEDITVSEAVQETIDRITELNGQYTLTSENTIRSIVFANAGELNYDDFELFAQQSDLETLRISNYRELNDSDVAKLAGLKKLRTLALTNSGITDDAIKMIAEFFPELVNLDIASNARLTDASAREIAKLKELEMLSLLFCDFGDFGMLHIVTLPKLKTLDIRGNFKIGNNGLRTLAKLPALRSLRHRSPAVMDDGVRSLAEAKGMTDLFIQDFAITGRSGEYLRQMERLTTLTIFRCDNFDSPGLLELKGLKLTRLVLRGLPVDDKGLEVFKDITTLKRLELHEMQSISDAGLENLVHLKDLEVLDIWGSPITDKTLAVVAKLPALKTLMLKATDVTDAGMELLFTMPKLESVTLTDNARVTLAMIQKLRDAKKFTVLPALPPAVSPKTN